jgi:hypothetical protein
VKFAQTAVADALEIIAGADRRLADEYDEAQGRGETFFGVRDYRRTEARPTRLFRDEPAVPGNLGRQERGCPDHKVVGDRRRSKGKDGPRAGATAPPNPGRATGPCRAAADATGRWPNRQPARFWFVPRTRPATGRGIALTRSSARAFRAAKGGERGRPGFGLRSRPRRATPHWMVQRRDPDGNEIARMCVPGIVRRARERLWPAELGSQLAIWTCARSARTSTGRERGTPRLSPLASREFQHRAAPSSRAGAVSCSEQERTSGPTHLSAGISAPGRVPTPHRSCKGRAAGWRVGADPGGIFAQIFIRAGVCAYSQRHSSLSRKNITDGPTNEPNQPADGNWQSYSH